MTHREKAQEVLDDFKMCYVAKPKHNAVDLQIEKDTCNKWATHLNNLLTWGSEQEIAEACHQLEPRLKRLKEKIIIEVLQHGI